MLSPADWSDVRRAYDRAADANVVLISQGLQAMGVPQRGDPVRVHAVTVVDAARVDALTEHDLAIEQVGYADIVVLSRERMRAIPNARARKGRRRRAELGFALDRKALERAFTACAAKTDTGGAR